MKCKVYLSPGARENPQYILVRYFFDVYGVMVEEIEDVRTLMLLSRGRTSPSDGFMFSVMGRSCYDIFDVTKVYEENGLRQT